MESLAETIRLSIESYLTNVHTSLIAKITKINETTINAKPVVNKLVRGESIALPEFIEIPPFFLQGGESYIAHPLSVGDYCFLIVSESCFDNWYNGQDNLEPREDRTFDYSDCIAIVGLNPQSKAIKIPKKTTMQGDVIQYGNYTHTGDRKQEGDYTVKGAVSVTGDYTGKGSVTQTGDYTLNGNITVTGDGNYSGEVTAKSVTAATVNATALAVGAITGADGAVMSSPIETTGDIIGNGISLTALEARVKALEARPT